MGDGERPECSEELMTDDLDARNKDDAHMAFERRRVDQKLQRLYAVQIVRDTPRPASLGPREKRAPKKPGERKGMKKRR